MTRTSRRLARGTTLIEAMIAIAVLLIGMAGFASLQVISVRANHFAKRISAASALAVDLTENVQRMDYNDARLSPLSTITTCTQADPQGCLNDATVLTNWDMGRNATPANALQYSDTTLASAVTPWNGIPIVGGGADVDRDGTPEFFRYYYVYTFHPAGSGPTAGGKFVQVIVRWKEPGFGFRQVTNMTFKVNPAVMNNRLGP